MYKVLVDIVSGKNDRKFSKGDLVNEDCLLNIPELIDIKAIEVVTTKDKKVKE